MTTALELLAAPAKSPITLFEAKNHCRVDFPDDDGLIEGLIASAVSHVDGLGMLGRAMITQTWGQWESRSPGVVRLGMGPFQSLVSIEYYDADGVLQTADVADYETVRDGDYSICRPKSGKDWPSTADRPDAIKISYKAGFGDDAVNVPAGVRQAILMMVSFWYENRDAAHKDKLTLLPFGVDALIGNERVGWYG